MRRVDKTVFISYRRTNSFHALAVYQHLTAHGYDCFLDYRNIDSGSFERVILENIASRAHFIVILTPSALERCAQPGDWLRREIEYALEIKRNIVPLMFDGFDFGTPSIANHLTGRLADLKAYNAQRVPSDFFDEALERVRMRLLNIPVDAVLHPRSAQADALAQQQQQAARSQPTVTEQQLSAEEWFKRGLKATNPTDKIQAYTEAIRLKPGYAAAYYNRGIVYNETGRNEQAIRDYTEAIRLKPDYALAYNNRGNAYRDLKRHDEAIRDYTEAIRLKPDFAEAYTGRGVAYENLKRYDDASRDHTEAIRLKPDYALAYYNRGVAYHNLNRYDDAIRDYNEAIRLKPDDANAYTGRGLAYRNLNRNYKAILDYNEAIRLQPDYALAYNNRGVAQEKNGDKAGAIADYEAALRIDPNYELARDNLRRLRG